MLVRRCVSKLYLVRHGETEWNIQGRYQGRRDSSLSERGQSQADVLSERIAKLDDYVLVSSPLGRALETARVIGSRSGREPALDTRLSELAYGAWEGLLQVDIAMAWPDALQVWKQKPHRMRFPGGESLLDVRRRVDRFFADARRSPIPIVAVTHDAFVRVAILAATAEPLAAYRRVRVPNASVTVFTPTDDGGWGIDAC